jgi:hypothetical protein
MSRDKVFQTVSKLPSVSDFQLPCEDFAHSTLMHHVINEDIKWEESICWKGAVH